MSAQSVAAMKKIKCFAALFADKTCFPESPRHKHVPSAAGITQGLFLQVFQRVHVSRGCRSVSAGCLLRDLKTWLVAVLDAQAPPHPPTLTPSCRQTHKHTHGDVRSHESAEGSELYVRPSVCRGVPGHYSIPKVSSVNTQEPLWASAST